MDYEIKHPGATADYLAFTTSGSYHKLEGRSSVHPGESFLKRGLTLYGDNAYVNSLYMCVPFKGAVAGPRDAYNFFQSQLLINIECAFGMLVQRFGILRHPMPVNFSLTKINALVGCLCKLHNFFINKRDNKPLQPRASNLTRITTHGGFGMPQFDNNAGDYSTDLVDNRINALLDGGHHFEGIRCAKTTRRTLVAVVEQVFPNEEMLDYVNERGSQRPMPRDRR